MASQEHRYIDPDLMNLDGGLFQDMHLRAPVEPEIAAEPIPVIAPKKADPRGRGRRAQAVRWMAVGATAALTGVGLAAASQLALWPWRAPQPELSRTAEPEPVAAHGPQTAPLAVPAPQVTPTVPVREAPRVDSRMGGAAPQEAGKPAQPAWKPVAGAAMAPAAPTAPAATTGAATAGAAQGAAPGSLQALEALVAPRAFSREAAAIAIASAARGAGGCTAPDDARTTMPVRVVYAPSGRVTSAALQGGPFMGTATGSCIARALQSATIQPFEGDPAGVTTTIHIR